MGQPITNYESHLFFIERCKNQYLPGWFLGDATRQEAEQVLNQSTGNVLMRKHSSFDNTGKYVITCRKGESSFRHYLVLNTPDGFLLDIDHKNNWPVNCLSEVMQLFLNLVGRGAKTITYDYLVPASAYGKLCDKARSSACENTPYDTGRSGKSTPLLVGSPTYVNVSQTPAAFELNRDVPLSAEKLSTNPINSYINVPQLATASNRDVPFNNEKLSNHPINSYINVPQLATASNSEKDWSSREDDFQLDFPPPPPPPPQYN